MTIDETTNALRNNVNITPDKVVDLKEFISTNHPDYYKMVKHQYSNYFTIIYREF